MLIMSSSVIFIVDDAHGWDGADYSIEGAQRVLNTIGVGDAFDFRSRYPSGPRHDTLASSLQEEISQLGRTFVAKVDLNLSAGPFPF